MKSHAVLRVLEFLPLRFLPAEAIDLMQGEEGSVRCNIPALQNPQSRPHTRVQDLNLGADCMNLMSAAILASDRVLTVSPNYATEVTILGTACRIGL